MASNELRNRKFLSDMGIYAIGNIGSKLITFMMIPLYSYFITDPADFGYYDICFNMAMLFYPFLSMELPEGGFRYMIETKSLRLHRAIVSTALLNLSRNILILIGIAIILGYTLSIRYLALTIAMGIAQTSYDTLNQLTRGLGRIKVYMAAGIINALCIATFSVITVVLLDWGVEGIFLANIAARLTSIIFMQLRTHVISGYTNLRYTDKEVTRKLFRYSLPLIPTVMFWGLMNSNNVFFIKHFLGLEANGIFGVVTRFMGIFIILTYIFQQTWQQNAIEQYRSADRNEFFSDIFNNFVYFLCLVATWFAIGLRANFFWLVSETYQPAAQYFYAIALYVVLFAVAQFLELGYQCSQNTRRLLPNLMIGAAINLIGNWLLLRYCGLYGAIFTNIITYIFLITYRWIDTRKYMRITPSPRLFIPLGILALTGIYYYALSGVVADWLFLALATALYALLLPKGLRSRLRTALHL